MATMGLILSENRPSGQLFGPSLSMSVPCPVLTQGVTFKFYLSKGICHVGVPFYQCVLIGNDPMESILIKIQIYFYSDF